MRDPVYVYLYKLNVYAFMTIILYMTYAYACVWCVQVGPQVLVLGEKAQKHGLATSLLQRMHGHYMSNAPSTKHLTC